MTIQPVIDAGQFRIIAEFEFGVSVASHVILRNCDLHKVSPTSYPNLHWSFA